MLVFYLVVSPTISPLGQEQQDATEGTLVKLLSDSRLIAVECPRKLREGSSAECPAKHERGEY